MKQLTFSQKITDRNSSKAFAKYLSDIRTIKPFANADEEYLCALKAFNGDKKALDELVYRNLKFVISVAKQYAGPKYPLEDLVNEGNYGLVEASKRFDPTKGFKFISYAVWYIRKNITDYMNKSSNQIKIPINKSASLLKLKKEISNLEQINQRPIVNTDLLYSNNLDLDIKEINGLLSVDSINMASLDSPFNSDENSGTLIDVLPNHESKSADHLINDGDAKKLMDLAMSKLSPIQQMIINLSYGLNGEEPLTLIEIGEKVDLSREGVRQIRHKALRLLKITMNKKGIKFEMFNN